MAISRTQAFDEYLFMKTIGSLVKSSSDFAHQNGKAVYLFKKLFGHSSFCCIGIHFEFYLNNLSF